jgi:hypothetical protein
MPKYKLKERRAYGYGSKLRCLTPEQFRSRYEVKDNGCWEWNRGAHVTGYGRLVHSDPIGTDYRGTYAHRVAYMLFVGPIPGGMTVDHKCFNRRCVNPAHLQLLSKERNSSKKQSDRLGVDVVTLGENCRRGHRVTNENLYVDHKGRSRCRLCRESDIRLKAQQKAKRARLGAEAREMGPRSVLEAAA